MAYDRKSLEQRAQITDIERLRHSELSRRTPKYSV